MQMSTNLIAYEQRQDYSRKGVHLSADYASPLTGAFKMSWVRILTGSELAQTLVVGT